MIHNARLNLHLQTCCYELIFNASFRQTASIAEFTAWNNFSYLRLEKYFEKSIKFYYYY